MNVKQRIDGCNTLHKNTLKNQRDLDIKDNCWICDGWNQHKIEWEKDKSGEGNIDPLFIHFNFENYKCNYFGKQNGPILSYERMFPPFSLNYFFTCDDQQDYDHSNEQNIVKNPEGDQIKDVQLYNDQIENIQIQYINKIEIQKSEKLFDSYFNPLITIVPRTRDPKYIPAKKKKQKVKWTFPISLFAKWQPDNEEILNKCFDFDWDNSKIPQKVKNKEDQELLKQFLREKYKLIKDAYKHFATFNPIQDIWCIQNAPWLEFISQLKIIDQKVKDADINLKWTATISGGDKGNIRNPERGISRHQLMEVLVRIAEEKYILKYQKCSTFFEAMKLFWEEHLEGNLDQRYNQQLWRNERYWNEQCDYCLKHYKKIIEHVYKKFAKQKVKPGQPPFMCLDELIKIIQLAGLAEDEHFGSTVGYFSFNMAMMTQVDELYNDRIYQMSLVEFYEALARIAEDANFPVGNGIVEEGFDWTWEKRKQQILAHKIEGLILRLFNTVCDASFKAQYPKIQKSFFVQTEDSDYE
ncbi:leucine rich repeat protein [Ichthyophthirius multifiliis]|uniref:Leucine rich repeat protein n=1 Tax=Ichthyophthirius multifiliis TaxID=5932 RepID=G0QNV9_ICHMU|nr:leucine rich repeat protein [Ichthyophthirius multifiliis]EGR33095.1 leucine rich repeat protein [Ichthyophthirius multifiliis]|eukprot:XP_004037081.1 leucine rich repeat protein [Ichthyophthirius multifiliis]